MSTAHPLPQASIAPHLEGPLGPAVFQWERKSPTWTPNFTSIVGYFLGSSLGLSSWESLRKSMRLDDCNQVEMEKGRGLTVTGSQIWACMDRYVSLAV